MAQVCKQSATFKLFVHCKCKGCRDKIRKSLRRLTERQCKCDGCDEYQFFCKNEVEEYNLDWKEQYVTVKGKLVVEEVITMISIATGKHTELVKADMDMAVIEKKEEVKLQTLVLRVGTRCLCKECEIKIRQVLDNLSGEVRSYCVDMKEQKVTITGCFDSCKLIKILVCRTGMPFELWKDKASEVFQKTCCASSKGRDIEPEERDHHDSDKIEVSAEPEKQLDVPPPPSPPPPPPPEKQSAPEIVETKSDKPENQAAASDETKEENHVPPEPELTEPAIQRDEERENDQNMDAVLVVEQIRIEIEAKVEEEPAQQPESEHKSVVEKEPKESGDPVIAVQEPEKDDEVEEVAKIEEEKSIVEGIYEREGCSSPHREDLCCEECVRRYYDGRQYYYGRQYTCFSDDNPNCCVM